jgi:hypothetical protein
MDFAAFFDHCRALREDGRDALAEHAVYRTLSSGVYVDYLDAWFDTFDADLRVMFAEDLAAEPVSTLRALFEWLGADPDPVDQLDLTARNRTQQPRSIGARKLAYRVNHWLRPLISDQSVVKKRLRSAYARVNSGQLEEQLSAEDRQRVEAFYEESVGRCAAMLRAHGYDELPAWLTRAEVSSRPGQ